MVARVMKIAAATMLVVGGIMVAVGGLATIPEDPIGLDGRPTIASTRYEPATTVPEAPSATTLPPIGVCWPVFVYAVEAGFTPEEALVVDQLAWLESRCDARAVGDGGESLGLMQIHAPSWCEPNRWNETGYLQAALVLDSCEELFDPVVAVKAARAVYLEGGFQQWSTFQP
jgi:hypothetical protein